jgi:hypothetical protein
MNNHLFVVTSIIFIDRNKTVFSPQERYTQTLETIKSIREKVPNSLIIIVESSPSNSPEITFPNVDVYKVSNPDYILQLPQSSGEAAMLLDFFESEKFKKIISENKIDYIHKLSGRYTLSGMFSLLNLHEDKPTFVKMYTGYADSKDGGECNTTLYNFPLKCLEFIKDRLRYTFECCKITSYMENIIMKDISDEYGNYINVIGVNGYVSRSGSYTCI